MEDVDRSKLVVLYSFFSHSYIDASSDEESDDDCDDMVSQLALCVSGNGNNVAGLGGGIGEVKWWVKPRSGEWIRELVGSRALFDDVRFYNNFRMRRATFTKLLGLVERRIEKQDTNFRKAVPARNVLLAFLYYCAHGVSYAVLHGKFGIGISTCSEILRRVANAICALGLIALPSESELVEIAARNELRSGIPQCTLSIDGSHIPFLQPQRPGQKYYNRKRLYSTVLHAAVDDRRLFRDVVIGWPGSVGDNRIFTNSYLGRNYESWLERVGKRQIATSATSTELLPMFLLGDCAYSNRRHFVTTFEMTQVASNAGIKRLNRALSRIRYKVEQSFGILKGRFRILLRANPTAVTDFEFVPTLVYALCSLHNFLILESDLYYSRTDVRREIAANPPQVGRQVQEESAVKTRDMLLRFSNNKFRASHVVQTAPAKAHDRAPSHVPENRDSPGSL